LSTKEAAQKLEKTKKKEKHFPQRLYAVKVGFGGEVLGLGDGVHGHVDGQGRRS
jgi:hypothetical protein